MDSSAICDYRMVRYMKALADKNNIKWQNELLPAGGTDTAGMQRMAKQGTIAVRSFYSYSPHSLGD
jgi:putative aminopeptidase FrvX